MRQSGAHRGPEKGKTDMQNKKKKNTTEIEGTISAAEASAALKARENEKPGKYSSPYADEIDSLLGSLSSREPFKYEASGDALFREYSDRYARDAKRAMKDTVGRVSSLTGGYGSSYAATAGSQAYGEKMSELGDIIPQLYKLAYTRYRDEGDDMRSLLSEYRDTDDEYYDRYRDGVSDWQTDLKRLAAAYESARDYEYDAARDTVKDEQWQREFDESVRQRASPRGSGSTMRALRSGAAQAPAAAAPVPDRAARATRRPTKRPSFLRSSSIRRTTTRHRATASAVRY